MNVLHPLQIDGAVVLGRDANMAFGHGARRRLGKTHAALRRLLVDGDKPLLREFWLKNGLGGVVLRDGVGWFLDPRQQTALLQVVQYLLARFVAIEPFVRPTVFIDARLLVHHADLRQVVALSDLKVVGIVRRRDFYGAASKLRISKVIGDDWNLPIDERKPQLFAYQLGVTRVFGIDGDRGIAKHRLRARGRHDHELFGTCPGLPRIVDQRITDLVELPGVLFVHYFEIGDRG